MARRGMAEQEILYDYPELEPDDFRAVYEFAARMVNPRRRECMTALYSVSSYDARVRPASAFEDRSQGPACDPTYWNVHPDRSMENASMSAR